MKNDHYGQSSQAVRTCALPVQVTHPESRTNAQTLQRICVKTNKTKRKTIREATKSICPFFPLLQAGKICLLAVFANGGEPNPHITSCMGFQDLFAIGSNLEVLKKKNERHTDKVATIHQNTDECETVSYASLLTNLAELITLATAALYLIHRNCRSRQVDITDVKTRAPTVLPAALLGDQRFEARPESTADARETTNRDDELLKMTHTALWIENGILCSKTRPTDPRSKKKKT